MVLRTLAKVIYWLAVLAVSVVLLVLLVSFFEARDQSRLHGSAALGAFQAWRMFNTRAAVMLRRAQGTLVELRTRAGSRRV